MVLFRLLIFAFIGLGFVGAVGWLTNWPFAVQCYGAQLAGLVAYQAESASPAHVPLWMSSEGAKLFLSLIKLFSLVSPILIGLMWFRWWWGPVGYVLGGLDATLSLSLGLLLWLGALGALVR